MTIQATLQLLSRPHSRKLMEISALALLECTRGQQQRQQTLL